MLAVLQIIIFRHFEGFNEQASLYAQMSFGDMGYSSNYCGKNFIKWDEIHNTKITLKCQGTTKIRRVIDLGIFDVMQSGEEASLKEFRRCFYERPIKYEEYPLMRNFDEAGIRASVMQSCYGLQECDVVIDQSLFGVPKAEQNLDQFAFIQAACE